MAASQTGRKLQEVDGLSGKPRQQWSGFEFENSGGQLQVIHICTCGGDTNGRTALREIYICDHTTDNSKHRINMDTNIANLLAHSVAACGQSIPHTGFVPEQRRVQSPEL